MVAVVALVVVAVGGGGGGGGRVNALVNIILVGAVVVVAHRADHMNIITTQIAAFVSSTFGSSHSESQ